jgi:hypothetical protein
VSAVPIEPSWPISQLQKKLNISGVKIEYWQIVLVLCRKEKTDEAVQIQ